MDENVPYMITVTKLHNMLDAIQKASVPSSFSNEFLKDLGFTSSNDRRLKSVLRYLGMTDGSGNPQDAYKKFVDHTKAKGVLAQQLQIAYDDLYLADKSAHNKTASDLKGWFKTKTGVGDAVAQKMASTFKSLASYADFTGVVAKPAEQEEKEPPPPGDDVPPPPPPPPSGTADFGLVYRFEIHLPDTQNVDTFRAIFKAMKEELMP